MRSQLEAALNRPLSFESMDVETQWEIDKGLGILDWSPSKEESDEYIRRRANMGDKFCKQLVNKKKIKK